MYNVNNFKRSMFICDGCGAVFPALREEFREDEGKLFVQCDCGKDAPEAWFMENLRHGDDKKTGPTSPEGKARVSRNGVKHGHYSDNYLFPRKPGEYFECEGCQDLEDCKADRSGYCHRKIEIHNKFMLAIKRGDPEAIKDIAAKNFAHAQLLVNHLFHDTFRLGAVLESPAWARLVDEDGNASIEPVKIDGKQIYEYQANPAIKPLAALLKDLGFTLPEFAATPKGQRDHETLKGHLDDQAASRQTSEEYLKTQTQAVEGLGDIFKKAKELRDGDPTTKRITDDLAAEEAEEEKEKSDVTGTE